MSDLAHQDQQDAAVRDAAAIIAGRGTRGSRDADHADVMAALTADLVTRVKERRTEACAPRHLAEPQVVYYLRWRPGVILCSACGIKELARLQTTGSPDGCDNCGRRDGPQVFGLHRVDCMIFAARYCATCIERSRS